VRLHTGAKPFRCPHCDQCFRTSGHRKSHVAQHFKTGDGVQSRRTPKARKNDDRYKMVLVDSAVKQAEAGGLTSDVDGGGGGDSSQVISVNQTLLQGVMPLSVAVNDLAVQLLQGGGIQLQVAGQQALLTGVDSGSSGVITQPIQLDASLLQQLQQGNVNLCINEKPDRSGTIVANVASTSVPEPVVPNLVIKSGVDPELTVIQSAFSNEAAILQGIGTTVVGESLLEQFQQQTASSDHKLMSTSYGDADDGDDADNVAGFDCADTSIMLGQKFLSSSSAADQDQHEELRNHVCGVRSAGVI